MAESESVELPPLTARQKAFVDNYLIDLNGTQAAIRAGYSANSANEQAYDLLARPHIAAAVERGKAQRAARVGVTQEQVLQEMALLANSSIEHYKITDDGYLAPTEDAPEGVMRAIQSVKRRKMVRESQDGSITITYEIEFKLWDKPTPLKLMGRHTGLFPNRVEVTGKNGAPIELTALSSEQLQDRARQLAERAQQLSDNEK